MSTDTPATNSGAEPLAWAGLFAAIALSRASVAPEILFDWDAANYALGLSDYDVFNHRPHPPGSPVLMLLWKAAALLFDPVMAMVSVNIVLSCGTVATVGSMARPTLGRLGAWLLGLCLACCPLFWMHGALTTAYVAEGFTSVGVAALGAAVLRGSLRLELAAVGWALLLGLRPNGLLTLTPLMAFVAWHRPTNLARAVTAGAVVILGWSLPMVAESGGLGAWRQATSALSAWQFKVGSALAGDFSAALRNLESLAMFLADAANIALLAMLCLVARRPQPSLLQLGFAASWLAPATLYYVLHHLPKAGYALTLVPAMFLGLALIARAMPRFALALSAIYIAANSMFFVTAVPPEAVIYGDAPELVPDRAVVAGDFSIRGMAYRTRPLRTLQQELDKSAELDRAMVFLTGAHELHRLSMAAFPEVPSVAVFVEHGTSWSTHDETSFGEWQLEVLGSPKLRGTDRSPTTVRWDGTTLTLERLGDRLMRPLDAARILVVYPCDPCVMSNAGPADASSIVELGAGYRATWLNRPVRRRPKN